MGSLPLLFVSTTLLARGQMPRWMQVAAHANPLDWGVRAVHEVVLPGTSWGRSASTSSSCSYSLP